MKQCPQRRKLRDFCISSKNSADFIILYLPPFIRSSPKNDNNGVHTQVYTDTVVRIHLSSLLGLDLIKRAVFWRNKLEIKRLAILYVVFEIV